MIPIVKRMVAEFFDNKVHLDCEINPQEIVAMGAALLAFQLANQPRVRKVELK